LNEEILKEYVIGNPFGNGQKRAAGAVFPTALCVLLAFVLVVSAACSGGSHPSTGSTDGSAEPQYIKYDEPAGPPVPVPVTLEISCAGDVMMHNPQIRAAKRDDGYDFSDYFQYVLPFIEEADLSLVNLEETFGGPPYNGYPLFSAPDELVGYVKDSGFDVAFTANNHMLDSGPKGIARTIEQIRESGLLQTGSVLSPEEDDWIVTDVNGVKVGIVAYTYESGVLAGRRTINGIPMTEETHELINSYDIQQFDKDSEEIKRSMDGARADGAQIVICYFHWGNEYQRAPADTQKTVAQFAADNGADVIFASHPHVLQPYEFLEGPDGANVPVFWSMGNFISNQRTESTGRYTEQGMIARVSIEYDITFNEIMNVNMDAIPTWVDKYSSGGRDIFTIVPLVGDLEDQQALKESGHLSKAKEALSDIGELLGQ
jgi:poly-gamma-glutamate synthesis protein (capsule biosynthesis protein)